VPANASSTPSTNRPHPPAAAQVVQRLHQLRIGFRHFMAASLDSE